MVMPLTHEQKIELLFNQQPVSHDLYPQLEDDDEE
jgi:hypothetical protein